MKLKKIFWWVIVLNIIGIIAVIIMFTKSQAISTHNKTGVVNPTEKHQQPFSNKDEQKSSTEQQNNNNNNRNSDSNISGDKNGNISSNKQRVDVYNKLQQIGNLTESEKQAKKNNTIVLNENAISKNDVYQEFFKQMNILRMLYDYPALDRSIHFNDLPDGGPLYDQPYMGLVNDANYCDYVDAFNIVYPSNIMNSMNVFNDYNSNGLARQLFKTYANDVMSDNISKDMSQELFNSVYYHLFIPLFRYFLFLDMG